eukprot:scaffold181255_cov51-Prasinocladus_malaysianus.AAC.1
MQSGGTQQDTSSIEIRITPLGFQRVQYRVTFCVTPRGVVLYSPLFCSELPARAIWRPLSSLHYG